MSRENVSLHLPLVYGAKAKILMSSMEQDNRLQSLWISEAERDVDERVECATLPQKLHRKASIYLAENRRIDQLLRRKPKLFKKKKKTRIVDDMLALEHRYRESAKIVQKAWRRYSLKQFWANYYRYLQASIQIQRVMRGSLCRKYVRIWYLSQLHHVTKIQATYRGFLYKRIIKTKVLWEHYNATVIQRYVRGYFARQQVIKIQENIAALHIQMLWRGYSSRKRSDRLWIARKAIVVQKHIRRFLIQKETRALRIAFHAAAIQIQRIFRGMLARMLIDTILYDRETTNRKMVMDVLDAEILWYKEYVDKLARRVTKSNLESMSSCYPIQYLIQRCRVLKMESEHHRAHVIINDLECIYLDMQEQRLKISPRAITDGWVYEMEAKLKKQRELITKAKLDAVFGHGLKFRSNAEKLVQMKQRVQQAKTRRDELERWRVEEFIDYWERDMHHQAERRMREQKQKIASERRKWKVKRYNKDGKVLVATKHQESTVFCIGSSNLLAFSKKYHAEKNAVTQLTEKVALVSSLAQVEQAKIMFQPLLDTFSSTYNGVHLALKEAPKTVAKESKPIEKEDAKEELVQVKKKKAARKPTKEASVPWALLDQLHAEREKLKVEKAMHFIFKKSNANAKSI